ncbi:MAG: hypothetical protein DMD36_05770, partial [Gemmatimonadetes bacterium]
MRRDARLCGGASRERVCRGAQRARLIQGLGAWRLRPRQARQEQRGEAERRHRAAAARSLPVPPGAGLRAEHAQHLPHLGRELGCI